jgi:OOP family OmpA-OmpF porin
MEKRILGALIAAAFATAAGAQSSQSTYVTSGAGGMVVTNAFGDCYQSGVVGSPAAGCPPVASVQVAQADSPRRGAATGGAVTTIGAPTAPVAAPAPGYVSSGAGVIATNPFGLCWRSGADWSPEKAAEPCDAVPRAAAAPAPVAAAPEPAVVAAPIAAAPPPPPVVIEKITLATDVLFAFNKADLLPGGQQKLDELANSAQGAEVEKVVLIGYADRIGSEEYNQELSERRAQAVADYLATKGVNKDRLEIEGRGKADPVTGNECTKMGPEKASNQKLVACLQPDRRVEAELLGSRESTAGTPAPAGAGATSGSPSSSGSGSSAK